MISKTPAPSPTQLTIVEWAARIGAVTANALADRDDCAVGSARARLYAAERAGLLHAERPLTDSPALFTATRAGLRVAGLTRVGLTRITASNAGHTVACAAVAAALERLYPDHLVTGERELRAQESDHGAALASARLGMTEHRIQLHRPDLVLWSQARPPSLPLAVEVELTVKAPRRLLDICRAWARCRCVAGVIYVASPSVRRPLARAIDAAHAGERIVVLGLEDLGREAEAPERAIERTVSSDA